MWRLDLAMGLVGMAVIAIGVGGAFVYGAEEPLETDQATTPDATGLVEETVSVASREAALPGTAHGETQVEIPIDVTTSNLQALDFLVEVRNSRALAGNLEWTFQVKAPGGETFDVPRSAALGPSTPGSELSLDLDLANANVTEPLGTWTLLLKGEVTGASAEDFPVSVTVDGTTLRPARDA